MTDLYELLKTGYSNDLEKQQDFANKNGYILKKDFTNNNHQVYYHPEKKQLLYNINGTQNSNINKIIDDWNTNLQIGLGNGEKTARFKQEKGNLEKAKKAIKDEYGDDFDTNITGHSQARFHASRIGDKNDKVVTYNGANPIGGKIKANETHYRVLTDPVSITTTGQKNNKGVSLTGFNPINYLPLSIPFTGASPFAPLVGNSLIGSAKLGLDSHNLEHLKNKKIKV